MLRFNVVFKIKKFEDTQNGFFFNHDPLDSTPQVYSSVSEISNHFILDYTQLIFYLFDPPISGVFFLIFFSLVVVASDLICSHINHLQYHVILIFIFFFELG